ncbi:hypothetical protein [Celeribacter sp.]|uniref:hypothetical protein n=1 Tax=Celeribacter sp. TaxID=1890673 RepID=UPI003A9475A4
MSEPTPFTENEMLDLAANAVRKIDSHGRRGTSMVTYDEIEAMDLTLICLGMNPNSGTQETPDATA